MFKTISFDNLSGEITTKETSSITVPSSTNAVAYGEVNGECTPVYLALTANQINSHQYVFDNLMNKTFKSEGFYVHFYYNIKDTAEHRTKNSVFYALTYGSDQLSIANILATNIPDITDLSWIKLYKSIWISGVYNTIYFLDGSSNQWYKLNSGSTPTVSSPGTEASSLQITEWDYTARLFSNALINITDKVSSIEAENNTQHLTINNRISANTDEIDRVESIVSDIDIETIRAELNEEITKVNTALGALDNLVDEKQTELDNKINTTKREMDELLEDAETDLSDMVHSFNESFSEEITNTKNSLQNQLEDAVTELHQLKNEVDENIDDIRNTVQDLTNDIEGTMRSVVTDIALTR